MENTEFYMREALQEAEKALLGGEFPVGCVFVLDGKVIGRGQRQNSREQGGNEIDHAEVLTLRRLLAEQPGLDCSRLTVFSTMEPCLMCYTTMLLSGIRRFVYGYEDVMGGGTNLELVRLSPLYREMKVIIIRDVLRDHCMLLFKRFFQNHSYRQGSLLADYTISQ